jgi:hypothetical protein
MCLRLRPPAVITWVMPGALRLPLPLPRLLHQGAAEKEEGKGKAKEATQVGACTYGLSRSMRCFRKYLYGSSGVTMPRTTLFFL